MPRFFALAFLVVLTGCSLGREDADLNLVAGTVDGVRLGASEADVEARLGVPSRREDQGSQVALSFGPGVQPPLAIVLCPVTEAGPLVVDRFIVRAPYAGRTAGGVGIGSSQSEFEADLDARGAGTCSVGLGTTVCTYGVGDHIVQVVYALTPVGGGTYRNVVDVFFVARRGAG